MSAIWLYPWVVISFFSSIVGLISGDLAFTRWVIGFLIFIPVLPIFSTLILILRGNHPGRQIFTIIAWGLAIAIVLLQWIDNLPQLFWLLWGILLYIGVAISALILEILALMEGRKLNQESAPAHHA